MKFLGLDGLNGNYGKFKGFVKKGQNAKGKSWEPKCNFQKCCSKHGVIPKNFGLIRKYKFY